MNISNASKLIHPIRLFTLVLLIEYAIVPTIVSYFLLPNPFFIEIAQLTILACIGISMGYRLRLFDSRFSESARRVTISEPLFHSIVWGSFTIFLIVTFATASEIPIISAFRGATATELSFQRGAFLKARVGYEAILLYLNTLYTSALLPYSLTLLFFKRGPFRRVAVILFLAYTVSFLQKALFLNVILPIAFIAFRNASLQNANLKWRSLKMFILGLVCIGGLYILTSLAFGNDFNAEVPMGGNFFEASYIPRNEIEHILWRSLSVPMFTASDTLLVFEQQYQGQMLLGATSSLFTWIFSWERVEMERAVFAYQWGWNDIANSNAVYITEAFVNFGWIGVTLFSLFIGQAIRWFYLSRDEAFKSLCIIFCLYLFSSGLIGTLLSNGYILIFGLGLFACIANGSPAAGRSRPQHISILLSNLPLKKSNLGVSAR